LTKTGAKIHIKNEKASIFPNRDKYSNAIQLNTQNKSSENNLKQRGLKGYYV